MLCPRGQAGLGYAVPAAIGVAAARPGRRIVVLTGDGALGYAVGELATVAEQRLPVTVLVLNNRSLGWIRWYRRITFGRGWDGDDFGDVAFAEVARGFGLHAERVTDPGRLGSALAAVPAGPRCWMWSPKPGRPRSRRTAAPSTTKPVTRPPRPDTEAEPDAPPP